MPNPFLKKLGRPVKRFSLHVLRKADRDRTGVRGISQNPKGLRQAGQQLFRARDAVKELGDWPEGVAGTYIAFDRMLDLLKHRIRNSIGKIIAGQKQHR
jgi:hypothetical protein